MNGDDYAGDASDFGAGLSDQDFMDYYNSLGSTDIGNLDLSNFAGDPGDFGVGLSDEDFSKYLDGLNADNVLLDPRDFQGPDLAEIDWNALYSEGMTPEQLALRDSLKDLPGQDLGVTAENQASYDSSLQDIMENRGGFTSGWQTGPNGERIMVSDDGSAIGINENGETYSLTADQTANLIRGGAINTAKSGYFGATGGSEVAPGGGTPVVMKNGTAGTLLSSGKVIDTNTGKVIGTAENVKGGVGTTTGNTGRRVDDTGMRGTKTVTDVIKNILGGTGKTDGSKGGLGGLLPLLLAILAMNKSKGEGAPASNAVIPALTATQKQTPYAQTQQAPGYRPGQGGITYFNPVQYTPRMAAGGIANLYGGGGRLLRGPGDGVSDSIPAMIGGMAEGGQPARLARGEYVIDARTVAALGNGSTDAGAERLDEMRKKVLSTDRKAKVGDDSKAYRHLKV